MKTPQELVNFLQDCGLSQSEIAIKANVSQATISRLASGAHKDTRSEIKDRLTLLVKDYQQKQGNSHHESE